MRRPDSAEALRVGALEMFQRDDRVGPFEAEDVAYRCIGGRAVLPAGHVPIQ
jgi:hypothetical protein